MWETFEQFLQPLTFTKILLFPQVFSRASPNGNFWKCNKMGMLFLRNMNSMIEHCYTILYSSKIPFLF